MRKELRFIFILVLLSILSTDAFAAKRYWVAANDSIWNSTRNWSTSSGGSFGASVPGSNDTAYFDGGSVMKDTFDVNVSVKRLEISSAYTGTIIQGAKTLTIGTSGAVLSGGTFSGGSANITVSGAFTISGTAFISTSGIFSTSANFTNSSGSFTHNSGTLSLTATSTLAVSNSGGTTFYDLAFAPTATAATFTITSTTSIVVSNMLSYGGTKAITLNTGTINVTGNITVSNTVINTAGTATIQINGTGKQTITGSTTLGTGQLPIITINKPSSDTVLLVNDISIGGNYTLTSGIVDAGTSWVFLNTLTVTGNQTLNNVWLSGAATITIASGTILTVTGSLSFGASAPAPIINTGTIYAKGTVDLSNETTNTGGGGTGTIVINGSGTQSLLGSTTLGSARICNFQINKSPSDTLKISNTITALGNWTYTAGIVSAGTSTIYFANTKTITGTHSLYNVLFYGGATSTYTIASGSILTINGYMKSNGTLGVTYNTGTIYAKGDIDVSGNTGAGGGTATIVINGSGTQRMTGSSSANARFCNVQINKSASDTLLLFNRICVSGNWTYTAGIINPGTSQLDFLGTKTITGSHTLNNVIFEGTAASIYTIASGTTLTVASVTTWGSSSLTYNTGTINVHGNINNACTYGGGGGTATFIINGTGTQTLLGNSSLGGWLPNIIINKSASDSLKLSSLISVAGNWTYASGIINPSTSTVRFINTKTISGSHTLGTVILSSTSTATITIASGTTLTTTGLLSLNGTAGVPITINTGTIEAKGNFSIGNTATTGGGTGTILIDGAGNQTLTGNGTAGQGRLPKITIDKTSDTLFLNSVISVAGDWIYNQGTVDPGSSTVVLYGTSNLDGQAAGMSSTMPFYNLTIGGNTRTLTGNLDVNNNLTINSGTTLSAGSNSISVGGAWNNSGGTWTYATSTVTFDGSGYGDIKHTSGGSSVLETFYNLAFNRSSCSHTLNCPVVVNHNLTLNKGHIKTSSSNYLELIDDATLTGGGDTAYVHGPMRKTGNDAFTFPLGDTTLVDTAYHPLGMTAPSSTSDQFEAAYFAHTYSVGDSLVDSLSSVSQVEYWTCERKVGSSNLTVTLGWNKNSDINDIGSLRVAAWNGTFWEDYGQGTLNINWPRGTVTASNALTFSVGGPVLIGIGVKRPTYYGYATLRRKLDGGLYESKSHSLYFKFDDEYNDELHNLSYKVINSANFDEAPNLVPSTNNSALSYYGDNRFRIDLFTVSGPLPSGYYILEVSNEKSESFYLRFYKN